MIYKISPFKPNGSVMAVPSKSYAHRLIILSALCKGQTLIKNVGESLDVQVTLDCVKKLGAKVQLSGGDALITGIEKLPQSVDLDFGESGSSMRFMLPLVCALGVDTSFTGRGKLLSRPNDALYEVLIKHGAKVETQRIYGKLTNGNYKINSTVSSQYISGLLMALPLLKGKSQIELVGDVVSKDYILITLEILKLFGINYQIQDNKLTLIDSEYISPKSCVVEGDWSSGAFPLSFGALGGSVSVAGLNPNSTQGDKRILDVLRQVGAQVVINGNIITVKNKNIRPVDVDITSIPDLAPVIASVVSFADGISVLRGVDRLRIKESDRLSAIMQNLSEANVETRYENDTLYVYGGVVKSGAFKGFNDHRMVMSACVLSSAVQGDCSVTDVEAVKKSYPNFFEDYLTIGGSYSVDI